MRFIQIIYFGLLINFSLTSAIFAKQIHVAFLGPELGQSAYWDSVIAPLKTVAEQFDIKLTLHHANWNDRFDYYPKAKELFESEDKPDYLISTFRGASAKHFLELVESHQVPFISIVTGVPKFEQKKVGVPQQHYKYWLAQILADDFESGFLLTNALIARTKNNEEKGVSLIAVGGDQLLASSNSRDKGLYQAIERNKNVEFLQLVHSNWNVAITKRMIRQLMSRYQSSDIIWAANDDVAIAAYQSLKSLNVDKKNMPIIGGVDWTIKGLEAIVADKIQVSVGGNHMHGVWALILVNDIAHGLTLTNRKGYTYKTPFAVADKKNAGKILAFLKAEQWREVDFKQFSKFYNDQVEEYDFNFIKLVL